MLFWRQARTINVERKQFLKNGFIVVLVSRVAQHRAFWNDLVEHGVVVVEPDKVFNSVAVGEVERVELKTGQAELDAIGYNALHRYGRWQSLHIPLQCPKYTLSHNVYIYVCVCVCIRI